MTPSSLRTTVWTHASSSPVPDLLGPRVMSVFRLLERVTGIDASEALVQAMLFGIGIAGPRLSWKLREPKSPPRVGRCSATLALPEDGWPWWLSLSLHTPLTLQDRANELSREQFLQQPSPAQLRLKRDQSKMLRAWMPQTPSTTMIAAQARRRPQNVDFLMTIPRRGWFKQADSAFGSDRLLLLCGNKDYERLIKHREVPPFLLEMESGGNNWPRVSFHGWMEQENLTRAVRNLDTESAGRLGWLVPAGSGKPLPEHGPEQLPTVNEFFHAMVMLRLGRVPFCFSPPPEIAGRLEAATNDLRVLLATQPLHLHPLGLHEDDLVWQLAALLSYLSKGNRNELLEPELHEIADAAGAIAGRVVAGHLNVLRRALPSGKRNDALVGPIVDRLAKGPATVRELVRSFHKIPTAEIEMSLQRLKQEGIVARLEGNRRAFVPVPLVDLSALLSENVAKSG